MARFRKMVTPYGVFEWKPTSNGPIVRRDGKSQLVRFPELDGRSQDTFDRGQWKRTRDGMITPGQVRAWIDRTYGSKGVE